MTRTLASWRPSSPRSSRPIPGRCTSIPRKSRAGCAEASARRFSPLPKPISIVSWASRPNSALGSSGCVAKATPYFGHSTSSARSCAAVIRPLRVTKERIERGCSVWLMRSCGCYCVFEARHARDHGISARGAGAAQGSLGEAHMSNWWSAGIIALAGALNWAAAAGAQEPPRAEGATEAAKPQPARAPEPPSAQAVLLGQLCKIDIKGEKKDQWMRLPKAESSVTQHHLTVGGRSFDYTATAGTLIIRDDEDKPIASIGYVAYVRHDAKGGVRPLMFAFNGGPGSSSLWLHMGVLGPKRVVVSDPGPTPAGPYRTVDNEFGVLDKSDLVMIDPVGTGLSHAVCDHRDDEFWAVDPDIDYVSRFIAQYVSDNNRWTSPKYLLGESYGTTRGAAIVNYLAGTALVRLQRPDTRLRRHRHRGDIRRAAGERAALRRIPAGVRGRGLVSPHAAQPAHRARAVPHRSARLRHGPLHRSAPQGRCARGCRPRGRGAEDARVHRVRSEEHT